MSEHPAPLLHPALPAPVGARNDAPSNPHEQAVMDYIRGLDKLLRTSAELVHVNFYDLLLREGVFFDPAPLPHTVAKGTPSYCFDNAQKLVLESTGLVYCEGFALAEIPMYHGWAVNAQGKVVDSTWASTRTGAGFAYFGIPFAREYLASRRKAYLRHKPPTLTLVDNHAQRWPLLTADPVGFRATAADFNALPKRTKRHRQ